jgi:hypothetical protein
MQRATFLCSYSRQRVSSLHHFRPQSFSIHCSTTLLKGKVNKLSFSEAKWSKVAKAFSLSEPPGDFELAKFVPPMCVLPLSFHHKVGLHAWETQDVYQERIDQSMEDGCWRMLEPVCLDGDVRFIIDVVPSAVPSPHRSSISRTSH